MSDRSALPPALRDLAEEGLIDGLLFQLKSGKEATVYVVYKEAEGSTPRRPTGTSITAPFGATRSTGRRG